MNCVGMKLLQCALALSLLLLLLADGDGALCVPRGGGAGSVQEEAGRCRSLPQLKLEVSTIIIPV